MLPCRSYLTSHEKLPGIGKGAYSVIGPAPPVWPHAAIPPMPTRIPTADMRTMPSDRIAHLPLVDDSLAVLELPPPPGVLIVLGCLYRRVKLKSRLSELSAYSLFQQ